MAQHPPESRTGRLHFAVVGAGIAGLACARELVAGGSRATIFERSGAVGGRLASLATDGGVFDIGAQYLTTQTEAFGAQVQRWADAGAVRPWAPTMAELDKGLMALVQQPGARFVGVPTMQAIAQDMAQGLDVVFDAPVGRIARGSAEWYLFDPRDRPLGIAGFDGLVLAVPSVEALRLVRAVSDFAQRLEPLRWNACWVASLTLSRPTGIEFDAAIINDDPILCWAARENSKPMRAAKDGAAERWLLQARTVWSNNFADLAPDEAARWMQRAFAARLARPMAQKSCVATCWRNATPSDILGEAFMWDAARVIGMTGDWCGGARVEAAYLSGLALAKTING